MAIATGIDIVNVARIKKIIEEKKESFLCRIFSPEEISYCDKKANRYQHYAARFAAKEAFLKALPKSAAPLSYKDIMVHKKGNAPYIALNTRKQQCLEHIHSISLSIAHEHEFAVAVVVLEYS